MTNVSKTTKTACKQNREGGNGISPGKAIIEKEYSIAHKERKHLQVLIQKYNSGNRQINQPKISEVIGRGLSPELVT